MAGKEGINSVEEIVDLMLHMDDEDSSSAGLTDDTGPSTPLLLVSADDITARHALEVTEHGARNMRIVLEVEEP